MAQKECGRDDSHSERIDIGAAVANVGWCEIGDNLRNV